MVVEWVGGPGRGRREGSGTFMDVVGMEEVVVVGGGTVVEDLEEEEGRGRAVVDVRPCCRSSVGGAMTTVASRGAETQALFGMWLSEECSMPFSSFSRGCCSGVCWWLGCRGGVGGCLALSRQRFFSGRGAELSGLGSAGVEDVRR